MPFTQEHLKAELERMAADRIAKVRAEAEEAERAEADAKAKRDRVAILVQEIRSLLHTEFPDHRAKFVVAQASDWVGEFSQPTDFDFAIGLRLHESENYRELMTFDVASTGDEIEVSTRLEGLSQTWEDDAGDAEELGERMTLTDAELHGESMSLSEAKEAIVDVLRNVIIASACGEFTLLDVPAADEATAWRDQEWRRQKQKAARERRELWVNRAWRAVVGVAICVTIARAFWVIVAR